MTQSRFEPMRTICVATSDGSGHILQRSTDHTRFAQNYMSRMPSSGLEMKSSLSDPSKKNR